MEKHSFNKIKNIFKEASQLRVTCAFIAVYYYEKSENIGWSGGKPKFKTKRHYGLGFRFVNMQNRVNP
jgi:hypothetical protein